MTCSLAAFAGEAASSTDPFASSCRQNRFFMDEEDEDDRSTIADSEPDDNPSAPSKAADLFDSGDEEEPQAQAQIVEKPRWVDLAESDDEEELRRQAVSKLAISKKPRWVDLVESDDDGEIRRPAAAKLDTFEADLVADEDEKSSHLHSRDVTSTPQKGDIVTPLSSSQYIGKEAPRDDGRGYPERSDKIAAKVAGKGYPERSDKGAGKAGKGAGKGFAAKGAGKGGKGKTGGNNAPKGKGKGNDKHQCQFIIGIEEDQQFRVVKRILGQGGENMKRIAWNADAKLRLRGVGSKFLEGPQEKESTDDLMLCISSQDEVGFENAKNLVTDLLKGIHRSYHSFCTKHGKNTPTLSFQLHEGYREGSR